MKHFHNPFTSDTECLGCGKRYDITSSKCPYCKADNPDYESHPELRSFEESPHIGWQRELALGLTGTLGLQIVALFVYFVTMCVALGIYQDANSVTAFMKGSVASTIINDVTYGLAAIIVISILNKTLPRLFSNFKWKNLAWGLLMGLAVMGFSTVWSSFVSALGGGTSGNEKAVSETIWAAPVAALIITGFVGPFVEELTYRVGVFGFFERCNKILAYAIASLLFGLAHVSNWASANDWLNFPSYWGAGFLFCLTYEKFGLVGSWSAHALNNTISVIFYLVQGKQ